jgi:hypothetical protein
MDEQTVLVKFSDGSQEGLQLMALSEFIRRSNGDRHATNMILGTILPPAAKARLRRWQIGVERHGGRDGHWKPN